MIPERIRWLEQIHFVSPFQLKISYCILILCLVLVYSCFILILILFQFSSSLFYSALFYFILFPPFHLIPLWVLCCSEHSSCPQSRWRQCFQILQSCLVFLYTFKFQKHCDC